MPMANPIELTAVTHDLPGGPELVATWTFAGEVLAEDDVRELGELWFKALRALAEHAGRSDAGGRTPSDVPLALLSQSEIDRLEAEWRNAK